MSVAEVKLL